MTRLERGVVYPWWLQDIDYDMCKEYCDNKGFTPHHTTLLDAIELKKIQGKINNNK